MMRLLVVAALLLATDGLSAVFTVNSTVDAPDAALGDGVCAAPGGPCTLRAAVHEANARFGMDSIVVPAGTYLLTRNQPLRITDGVTITGAGAATTIVDGGGDTLVFHVDPELDSEFIGARIDISGITIQNGNRGVLAAEDGFDLTFTRCTLRNNRVTNQAGAGFAGGGRTTFRECALYGNEATGTNAEAGAIFYVNVGQSREESLRIENSTITGNTSGLSGAVAVEGLHPVVIVNSTIVANTGRGLNRAGDNNAAVIDRPLIRNSIIDGCGFSPPISQGGNISPGADCAFTSASDLQNTDPMLGPLADNGGPTLTRAPLPGSPAIDRGVACPPPYGDQRGFARPAGAQCDSGAVESSATAAAAPPAGTPGTLQFTAADGTFAESNFVRVYVERVGGTSGTVSAYVVPSPGTAQPGTDYVLRPVYVSFGDGEGGTRVADVFVELIDDFVAEPAETFTLGFTDVTGGATIGAPSTFTATITDSDAPAPAGPGQFSFFPPSSVNELTPSLTVSVSRFSGSTGAVAVDYRTVALTATAGSDYQTVAGTLSWADGDSSAKTFAIPILDDALVDPAETFVVELTNPTGGATVGTGSRTIRIDDDESPNPGLVRFSAPSYSGSESTRTATVTVERVGGSSGGASVSYRAVIGTADFSDFTPAPGFLSWAAGNAAPKTITVAITDDDLLDPGETFTMVLSAANGATMGSPSTSTVAIDDNDDVAPVQPPGTIQFATVFPDGTATESGGSARLTVARVAGSAGAVSVDFATAPIDAQPGTDYQATTGTLSWADGDTAQKTITVPIVDDAVPEPNETLSVTLSNPTGGATIVGSATDTIRIVDDDRTPASSGLLQFTITSLAVTEGGANFLIQVDRVGNTIGSVTGTVDVVAGTALENVDFTFLGGSVVQWNHADGGSRFMEVQVENDTIAEPPETFTIRITGTTGDAGIGTPSELTVTINDNDGGAPPPAGSIGMAVALLSVNEAAGSVTLSAVRNASSAGAVSVQYTTIPGTASAGSDFQAVTGTLAWSDGDSAAKTIVVPILNDALAEGNESFSVALATPSGGATLEALSATVVTITDDETSGSAGTVAFSGASTASAAEGAGSFTLTVSRSGGSAGAISVQYATAGGTATPGSDFQTAGGTLSWADGDGAPKSVTITILDDVVPDDGETFTVVLSNPAGGASVGAIGSVTVTIADNDLAAGIPTLSPMMLALLALAMAVVGWRASGKG